MMLSPEDLVGKYWADYYRRWHASSEVPEALDREVVGKLLSKDWEREYDAVSNGSPVGDKVKEDPQWLALC